LILIWFIDIIIRLAVDGIDLSSPIPAIGPRVRTSFEEDFLINYPKISIANLLEIVEDGIYVVSAVVDGLVEAEDWWFPACRCQRSVSADSGAYYCKLCVKHVFKMIPRFDYIIYSFILFDLLVVIIAMYFFC
jgi:hypothetical protein